MKRPSLSAMVKEFLTICPQTTLSIGNMVFLADEFTLFWPTGINGSLPMIQPVLEAQITGYAHWPISREAIGQARTAEELYDLIDWKHPTAFWWHSFDRVEFSPGMPPKQMKIGDEVWDVEQPPKLYDTFPHPITGVTKMYKYAYEAVLYRYSPDLQKMQFAKAVWEVPEFFEVDARDRNIPYPPLNNNDYFPFVYWELPTRLDIPMITGDPVSG